ncbi:hypothetical protein GF345_00360 [Candidatus Woesearchaeota archaeon]|nr:hypothetical protein [Candidatus Woesearchaeota archaeon]
MKIEINILKKHLWLTIAVIVMIGAAGFVIAQTYSADQPSHGTLFTDLITGKSGTGVTVDDDLKLTGTVANADPAGNVIVDDQLVVTGYTRVEGTNGLDITNDAAVGGNIEVSGSVLNPDGDIVTIDDRLHVSGAISNSDSTSDLVLGGNTRVNGDFAVSGNFMPGRCDVLFYGKPANSGSKSVENDLTSGGYEFNSNGDTINLQCPSTHPVLLDVDYAFFRDTWHSEGEYMYIGVQDRWPGQINLKCHAGGGMGNRCREGIFITCCR